MLTWRVSAGDVEFDAVGRVALIIDTEKLSQLIQEILLVESDDRGFGASIGKTGFDVTSEVYEGIRRCISLQNKSPYKREGAEEIKEIQNLEVVNRAKTSLQFKLAIKSKADIVVIEEVGL